MGRLLRFWSLPQRERQFFFEAAILFFFSHLSVKTLAFRRIDSFLRTHWNDNARNGIDVTEVVKLVDVSLSRVVNLLPLKNLCLTRSMAAFIMLRRRGIPAVIVAGVKLSGTSALNAHAWIDTDHAEPNASSENSAFTAVVRIGQDR